MPLSAAERCRRYREKLKITNPEKFETQKKKNAERTKAKKRKIADMSEEEKNSMRKQWRDSKRKKEEKCELVPQVIDHVERKRRMYRSKLLHENQVLKNKNNLLCIRNASLRKTLLRYKKNNIYLCNELDTLTRQLKEEKNKHYLKTPDTPITKFINEETPDISEQSKEKVRKKLLESHVLEESLKESYKASKSIEEKNVLKKIVETETVRKYKMQTKIRKCLGLRRGIRHYPSLKQKKMSTAREVKLFFERDDISRMTAGKKECITRQKIKKQKRFLLNTLSNLYKVYKNDGGLVSFSTFKRYRPFYVVSPRVANRNTCACIKHANLAFKAQTLKKAGAILTADTNDLVSEIVCDTKSKQCMYSECSECFERKLSFVNATDDEEVSWQEWTTVTHEYKKSGIDKTTKKTIQEERKGTINTLANIFQDELAKFKSHHFNIYHQHNQYKIAIEDIQDNEVIIHCDFSENYACKMAEEVQSMHFAGSRQQITLHTGVIYVKNQKPICFCSVSPSLKHDPQAIWGHLAPVVEFVKTNFPIINCVHFYSDGPTTQYRQKKNFWLFSEITKEAGFLEATWSFFEASHGKGAADGVGGAIKRTLDSKVSYGENIVDAISAFETLSKSETTVKVFYVSEDTIEGIKIPESLQPVPNTMKIHQIISTEAKNIIKHRPLSCFCARGSCNCFSPKKHDLTLKHSVTRKNKDNSSINNDKIISKKKANKIRKESISTSEDSNDIQYDNDSDRTYISDTDNVHDSREIDKTPVKVTILSQVRNTKENQKYFDLTKYGPLSLKPINIDFDLCSSEGKSMRSSIQKEKENFDIYANPKPCGSKDENMGLTELYTINDSVLVRYYQRNSWKYYIGFIDKKEYKDCEALYTVRFLKSIHKDTDFKFIFPKKKDIDIITSMSIVKKIELTQQKDSKEYCLTNDSDNIYF